MSYIIARSKKNEIFRYFTDRICFFKANVLTIHYHFCIPQHALQKNVHTHLENWNIKHCISSLASVAIHFHWVKYCLSCGVREVFKMKDD